MSPRRFIMLVLPAVVMLTAATPPPASEPVSAIRLNQIGFLPDSGKRAVMADASKSPLPWRVVDPSGNTITSGRTTVVGDDAASGDHVHLIEFGRLATPGTYRVVVAGHTSRAFPIRAGLYAPLAAAALNYFYQTRAGIPIEARFAGGARWARPAGHPKEIAPCFKGKDERGTDWAGCSYSLDVTGGWYDAGDQGKYVVNGGISLWTLQNLYEREAGKARFDFADGPARIPESGNGIDDLLDEARWEMRFLMAMQVPDGGRARVPVGRLSRGAALTFRDIDAGGMAHQKVADCRWTSLPTRPQDDREDRLLYPPTTGATLNLAATAAQCARNWRTIDAGFAAACLTAAQRAYAAALRNPEVYATSSFTGSGGYGDDDLADELYWATAELWATTGQARYGEALRRMPAFTATVREPNWGSVAALGTITLATAAGVPQADAARARAMLVTAADQFLAEEARSGYRIPYATLAYPWGSNSSILNRAMILGLAHGFTGEARYRDGAVDVMDYVLGRNPLDQSYVSGFGARPLMNPHHRFWAHQLDATLPGPPPGVVSGGPNSTAMSDPIAAAMKGGCAPQRCWKDEITAYALNEVAINWNAPLLWVAAYLDERQTAGEPR
ncbi:glycoside hydrolase family 9 protein [Microvirga sp. SRT01]|uniref:Endoglucanase n=1 Tax=Sphingomonas longa TaxID=2778730 RepID=A0ABS2D502_9SPHN|nr:MULTISPECIES: glycoside hydrolase family 9 protein [Alphaproteobacteria]MBM6575985.1 glycoside hydrolase family 9 protein [Sphingomonas sp. BT552]MBR7709031.1 glycoside hydrolase family 9 protein [Microvirga sp. SRT01]